MTEPRELSEQEGRLLKELVDTGGFDAVLAARVTGELKYFPPEMLEDYVQASAWLMLARARQTAALKRIQKKAAGVQPHVAQGMLILWAAQASEVAEKKLKEFAPQAATEEAPQAGDGAPPA